MRETCKQFYLLLFLTFLIALCPPVLLHAKAAVTDSHRTEAGIESVLGVDSCDDYNWELSSDGTYWYARNI